MHFNLSQISDYSLVTILLLVLFLISFIVQLIYWCFLFSKLANFKSPPKISHNKDKEEQPVSVIICARNEAENLEKNLPRILNQNYRSFEVVVVIKI